MDDNMKIIKCVKESVFFFIKSVGKTESEKKVGFLSMLLGTLGASF